MCRELNAVCRALRCGSHDPRRWCSLSSFVPLLLSQCFFCLFFSLLSFFFSLFVSFFPSRSSFLPSFLPYFLPSFLPSFICSFIDSFIVSSWPFFRAMASRGQDHRIPPPQAPGSPPSVAFCAPIIETDRKPLKTPATKLRPSGRMRPNANQWGPIGSPQFSLQTP